MSHEGIMRERISRAIRILEELSARDADPWSGRMFTHTYDPGISELLEATWKAFRMYRDKTMLDFTVYPSIVELEKRLVGFVGKLVNAPAGYSGAYTYGGTESIILAALAARESWRRRGGVGTPKIIIPETGHPAFDKAGFLLGMRTVRVPVDRETWTVDPATILDAVDDETAMVAVSAVNYPFGTLDPVVEVAEALPEHIWFHVDACLGGMLLAFYDNIPPWDFRVSRVDSLSIDLHKYGYAPKGASLVLFRRGEDRKATIFVHTDWPGYPLVNEAILSTRSAAPLAAAWLIATALGVEGYRKLARMVDEARRIIVEGASTAGFTVLGNPVAGVVTLTAPHIDVFRAASKLAGAGWIVQLQPGNANRGWPPSIHLTISPVHAAIAEEFVRDLATAAREAKGRQEAPDLDTVIGWFEREGLTHRVLEAVDRLFHALPPDVSQAMVRDFILEIFKPVGEWL